MLETRIVQLTQSVDNLLEATNKHDSRIKASIDRAKEFEETLSSLESAVRINTVTITNGISVASDLAKAVIELNNSIAKLTSQNDESVTGLLRVAKTEESTEPKPEPKSKSKPEPEPTITSEELQRYVLSIVRDNRYLREPIKCLIRELTGADYISAIPSDKLNEVKVAIDNLVNTND